MKDLAALVTGFSIVCLAAGCGKTEQYRDTGERFTPVWVRQSDGAAATREEISRARDECAARVKDDTRRAGETYAPDVWGYQMRKCMADKGLDLVEKPKPTQ